MTDDDLTYRWIPEGVVITPPKLRRGLTHRVADVLTVALFVVVLVAKAIQEVRERWSA